MYSSRTCINPMHNINPLVLDLSTLGLSITLAIPGLSEARATIRRLLFCVLEKLRFCGILTSCTVQQCRAFVGDVRVRTRSHPPKESAAETPPVQRVRRRGQAPESTPVERALGRASVLEPAPRVMLASKWRQPGWKGSSTITCKKQERHYRSRER